MPLVAGAPDPGEGAAPFGSPAPDLSRNNVLSYDVSEMCRVCLAPTTSRRNSNLFFSSGRSVQLWAKVMACAWVQVFEGDGLPSQICYKCHNKLDIAYQFKQQCEAADAYIRQLLSRSAGGKGNIAPTELAQGQTECLSECKPLNYNITTECLDLVQSDLSLPSLRLSNQDITSSQLDFRIRDSDFAAMKQEPGFMNTITSLLPTKGNECPMSSSFKCENYIENEIILNNLPAKLFESVTESISQGGSELTAQIDSKLVIWDLNQKDQSGVLGKADFLFNSDDKENEININKDNIAGDHVDITFLTDDRSVSPLDEKCILPEVPEVCSDSSSMEIDNECTFVNSDKDFCLPEAYEQPAPPLLPVEEPVPQELPPLVEPVVAKKKRRKKSAKGKDEINIKPKTKQRKKNVQEQCELCGKVFKYGSYMVQHLRTHTGVKPFSCSHCDQKFSLYHSLVTHMRIHSGDRPYICAVCGKGFSQSAGLKLHMRAHTGEKPFECDVCKKTFSQKSNLIIHKQIHSGKRDHVCVVCNKAFKFYKHLQSHMALHSNEKEFKCSVCDKSFHRKSYLRMHLAIHSGERPFKCNICDHAFSNPSNLRAHSRIHSGVKPYKCKVCKKAFVQSSALNRHMQQHSTEPTNTLPPMRLIE